jgi:hypothetical protein
MLQCARSPAHVTLGVLGDLGALGVRNRLEFLSFTERPPRNEVNKNERGAIV